MASCLFFSFNKWRVMVFSLFLFGSSGFVCVFGCACMHFARQSSFAILAVMFLVRRYRYACQPCIGKHSSMINGYMNKECEPSVCAPSLSYSLSVSLLFSFRNLMYQFFLFRRMCACMHPYAFLQQGHYVHMFIPNWNRKSRVECKKKKKE